MGSSVESPEQYRDEVFRLFEHARDGRCKPPPLDVALVGIQSLLLAIRVDTVNPVTAEIARQVGGWVKTYFADVESAEIEQQELREREHM